MSCDNGRLLVLVVIGLAIAGIIYAMVRWNRAHERRGRNNDIDWPTIGAFAVPLVALALVLLIGLAAGPIYNLPAIGPLLSCD